MMAGQGKTKGVGSTSAIQPRQKIQKCCQAITHQWYLALASIGSFQVDRTEALQKFANLTDKVIAFLLAENPQMSAAREIGADLASLPCLDPLAIEISGDLWAGQLVACEFPVEPDVLFNRLSRLMNGMANGYVRHTRAIVLDEQEGIRAAMAADLLRTSEELRKYQFQLEEMLAERTRELRESEEQFRVIADTSIEGIYQSSDDSALLIYVNNAFAKLLGYTKEELLGKSTRSLIAEMELPKLSLITEDYRANRPVYGEMRLIHKDGHLVDVHFSMVPTLLNGRNVRSGILQDITERKRIQTELFQSEERYRTLSEASPSMIFIIGQDDRIQYVNSNAAAYINLPPDEINGQQFERFSLPRIIDRQNKVLQKVIRNGKPVYEEEEIKKDNRTIWLGVWLVPLRDASGNVSGVMGVARDISRQKRAEMEIRRSRDLMKKRVEERTAELTNSQSQLRQLTDRLVTALEEERRRISRELHDEAGQALISLKYGLASIESNIPENNKYARQRLVESMDSIDRLMQQIRTLSHSLRPPVLEIAGINLCLKDYCDEIAKRIGLPILYQGEEIPGLSDEIGISLYRFVQEALTNIVKHARATKVEVRLQYGKDQVVLSVSDNGRGMDVKPKSDGIGLIGIEERLTLIGGSLEIRSRKRKGAKITASVPWPRPAEKIQGQATG
jgi:PAS domain S-box-containing protein